MEAYNLTSYRFLSTRSLVTDISALVLLTLVPAFSHLSGIPVYFIEPMRLLMVAAILLSHRANAYLLALLLPLVSFLVSGHPEPLKMTIIMAELSLNVWLFFAFLKRIKRPFLSMFLAIAGSKLFCYSLYLIIFSPAFVKSESEPIFLIVQLAVTLLLSTLASLALTIKTGQPVD